MVRVLELTVLTANAAPLGCGRDYRPIGCADTILPAWFRSRHREAIASKVGSEGDLGMRYGHSSLVGPPDALAEEYP